LTIDWLKGISATDFMDEHGFLNQSVKIREISGKVLGDRSLQVMSCIPVWAKFWCRVL
jgi:hypothetical protein